MPLRPWLQPLWLHIDRCDTMTNNGVIMSQFSKLLLLCTFCSLGLFGESIDTFYGPIEFANLFSLI